MIVYVSGKYSGAIDENITAARKVAIEIWEKGHAAICPHLNTANFENDCKAGYDDYINGDLDLLARCDAIVMLPGWEESKGANIEHNYARARGIPIHFYPDLPGKHSTEIFRPNQTARFIDIIMRMYRVHLDKNADYSPANILGTGEIGLVTRIWDKVSRLMNLSGFRVEISRSTYAQPLTPKNESVDDTLMDLAVYGIIGLIYRDGAWGN